MDDMTRIEGNGLSPSARDGYWAWRHSIERSKPGMDAKTQSRIAKIRRWELQALARRMVETARRLAR